MYKRFSSCCCCCCWCWASRTRQNSCWQVSGKGCASKLNLHGQQKHPTPAGNKNTQTNAIKSHRQQQAEGKKDVYDVKNNNRKLKKLRVYQLSLKSCFKFACHFMLYVRDFQIIISPIFCCPLCLTKGLNEQANVSYSN